MLENKEHKVDVIDCNAEGINENAIKKAILSSDAVGMTIYSTPTVLYNSIMLSSIIKECDSSIPLLIGGPHCTVIPKRSLIDHHADICVSGEGERVITLLADAIEGKRKLSTVPGIFYKEHNKIKQTKPLKQIEDLDKIPFPARDLVDKYEYGYMLGTKIARGKTTSFLTSRGCPHHCKYCQLNTIIPKFRTRSINNITKEIEETVNAGYNTLVFVDDNFFTQKKKVEEIMDFIIHKEIDIDLWITGGRVDSADKRLYEKMRDAGVKFISFGIESGNQDVIDFYDKKITLDQIRKAVNLSKKMNFFTSGNFILGALIETEKHIKQTIKFAKSLPLNNVGFFVLDYFHGSPLWAEAVKDGKIQLDEYLVVADVERGLSNFTSEELINYTRKAYKNFILNPHLWTKELFHSFATKDFLSLKLALELLRQHV